MRLQNNQKHKERILLNKTEKYLENKLEYLGEVVSGEVSSSIKLKLKKESEEVKIGYPVVVEGKRYDYFCIVSDIVFPPTTAVTMLANAEKLRNTLPMQSLDTARGRTFFSLADLQCVQMIDKSSNKTFKFETLPPYFSSGRFANERDVDRVYQSDKPEYSQSVGTLRGVEGFEIPIDFEELVKVPFGIFGRTHSGKTFLNKIILGNILHLDISRILIFDMQSEYGWRSRADNSPGLKFFFEEKVTLLGLDPKTNKELDDVLKIGEDEITPEDLLVAFQDLTDGMRDAIFEIHKKNESNSKDTLIQAILNAPDNIELKAYKAAKGTLMALSRRMGRLERLDFISDPGKGTLNKLLPLINSGQSIIIDFGKFGSDYLTYMFVANIISRRLYESYSEAEFPRLVVLLEEAHKFLDPSVARRTIFDKLTREMRKFNLILAMVDQRPSKIDSEILSQLANRFILSLNDPKDVDSALSGPVDPSSWRAIVKAMPPRTVLMFGDAIKAPTTMDVLMYSERLMKEKWTVDPTRARFKEKMAQLEVDDQAVDDLFRS